jgi:hypothetical protein
MKYFLITLTFLFIRCSDIPKEIEIDPLSKAYILKKILHNSTNDKNVVFFMYPEFCGMCTEEMVHFINNFSHEGYSKYVAVTQQNELTAKLNLPKSCISLHDKIDLEKHGLGFVTGHIFIVNDERFIYSQILNDETFSIVTDETQKLLKE